MNRKFCIAPMLDWTDRHERYFLRLITKYAVLYTEMVTTGAVIYGDRERLLGFSEEEHPVALQLGGSEPSALAEAAIIGEESGYDEINLNVGCPSDRVQSGMFGACLMKQPGLVAECVATMQHAVQIPVTVKCRIGVDEFESYDYFRNFISVVSEAGCNVFIVHARKAWLQGLSPKENREIPELKYEYVYQLKRDYPELEIILNGGLTDLKTAHQQLAYVDGVMLGREAYNNPYILTKVDQVFYGDKALTENSRLDILRKYIDYMEIQSGRGVPARSMIKHALGLFKGQRHGKAWRRYISETVLTSGGGIDEIKRSLGFFDPHAV